MMHKKYTYFLHFFLVDGDKLHIFKLLQNSANNFGHKIFQPVIEQGGNLFSNHLYQCVNIGAITTVPHKANFFTDDMSYLSPTCLEV